MHALHPYDAQSKNLSADNMGPVTFAMANLFQVLESNIGIIAASLPVLRAPLRRAFPKIFSTTRGSKSQPKYYEDGYKNDYALHNMSAHSKASGGPGWQNSTSLSSPDILKSAPRRSDELGMIREAAMDNDGDSNANGDVETGRWYHTGDGIRKTVEVEVRR
jgi:hypothetical protein